MVTIFKTFTLFLIAHIFASAFSVEINPQHSLSPSSIDSSKISLTKSFTFETKVEKKHKKSQFDFLWIWYSSNSTVITEFSSVLISHVAKTTNQVSYVFGARAPPV